MESENSDHRKMNYGDDSSSSSSRNHTNKKQKIRRSDSNSSSSTTESQIMAMKQYERIGSKYSRSKTFSDDSSNEDDEGTRNQNILSKLPNGSKSKKRRKLTIDSDSSSDGDDDTASSSKKLSSNKGVSSNDVPTVVAVPKRKQGMGDSSGAIFSKRNLKPVLKVGDKVYAAWWGEDEESRRTDSRSSWYEGRITAVKEGNTGSDEYGPVRYYDIEYDDGDELSAVSDMYVYPKFDYLLHTQNLRNNWMGVKSVIDEQSTDEWARCVGYHEATIDGQVYSYPLLSDALRAYDTSVVYRKGRSSQLGDLNLPGEWDFASGSSDSAKDETCTNIMIMISNWKGIMFRPEKKKYKAKISYGGEDINLGYYKLASDAALVHDKALILLKGANAKTNFASYQHHESSRATEMKGTSSNVNFEKVLSKISSKIESLVSKICSSEPDGSSIMMSQGSNDGVLGEKIQSGGESSSSECSSIEKKASKYLGVTYDKRDKKWRTQLRHDNKRYCLGYYKLESDAALAWDEAAKQLKGPSTETNFASLKDYEKAKKNELAKSGLSNEAAMSSSAIVAKVKHAISKRNSKDAGISFGVGFRQGFSQTFSDNEATEDLEDNTAASTSTSTKKKECFKKRKQEEKAKKTELARSGLSNNDAMSSSAIEAKVNEILRTSASVSIAKALEEDLLTATSISLASPENEDNVHSTKSAQLAALNETMAEKWAPYLPSGGKDFLVGYQKSINGIIQQDLKPKANEGDVPVSVDNIPTSADLPSKPANNVIKMNETVSAAEPLTTTMHDKDEVPHELPGNPTAEESCTQKMSNASLRHDNQQKPATANDAHLSQAKSFEGGQSSTTGTVQSTTSTKQAKKPQLTRLTNSQVSELCLPYPVGCPVWSQFGKDSNSNSIDVNLGNSFRTGTVTGVFMDFSAIGGFFYQVQFGGGEETNMIPDSQLCYAPKCPVTITTNNSTHLVQGEVLMGRAKSRQDVTLLLKECLLKEQSMSNTQDLWSLNQRLQDILDKLGTIQMTRHILASTYIGKSVKQLVKYHGGNNAVAHKAFDLVKKWKAIAVAEKNQTIDTNTNSQNEICAFTYTILITKGTNRFHVEENVPSDRVNYIRNEEQESSNSTITTAPGLY